MASHTNNSIEFPIPCISNRQTTALCPQIKENVKRVDAEHPFFEIHRNIINLEKRVADGLRPLVTILNFNHKVVGSNPCDIGFFRVFSDDSPSFGQLYTRPIAHAIGKRELGRRKDIFRQQNYKEQRTNGKGARVFVEVVSLVFHPDIMVKKKMERGQMIICLYLRFFEVSIENQQSPQFCGFMYMHHE